jgi:hypothetical protein
LSYEDIGYFVINVGSEKKDTVFEKTGDNINLSSGTSFDSWERWW